MPLMQTLIDSSFLYTVLDRSTPKHALAVNATKQSTTAYLIPDVVLTETAFLFQRAGGVQAVIHFLDVLVAAQWQYEPVTTVDLIRAREIMAAYPDSRLDFVDCCIMAIAERLNVRDIATFDRRDFGIVRPAHCDYFRISP